MGVKDFSCDRDCSPVRNIRKIKGVLSDGTSSSERTTTDLMGTEPCSVDDLWAGDRSRVGVCVSVTPKDGIPYDHLQREVFGRVDWPERELRWHQHRRAPGDATTGDDDDANGWVMEATLSCLASSGDESQVAYRIEGLARDVVEEAEVVVSAPCHVPFMELTLRDLDVSAAAVTHRHLGNDDADDAGRRSADVEPRHSPVDIFLRTGLAASCRSAVAPDDLARLIAVANARMSNAEAALATNHPTLDVGADVFAFREMGSRGGRRFDLLFPKPEWERDETEDARNDAAFIRAFAASAPWVPTLIDPLLGKNEPRPRVNIDGSSSSDPRTSSSGSADAWWCDVSIVYSKLGAGDQDWHCDGRHLAGESRADFTGCGVSAPYAVCVFVPLCDLNQEVGFTQFWGGSHVTDGLIGFGAAAEVLRGCVDGVVDAGGFVAYDYRTMHRGMRNTSDGTTRPVLQFLYARSNYRETKNYGGSSIFRPAST